MGKIIVAGIGPGDKEDITPAVVEAVRQADAIVGYKYYFQFIEPFIADSLFRLPRRKMPLSVPL